MHVVDGDAGRRRVEVGWLGGRVGKGEAVAALGAEVAQRARASVPRRAALAERRELPVCRVGLGAGLEEGVCRAGVVGGLDVAAGFGFVSGEERNLGGWGAGLNSRCPARREHGAGRALPGDQDRVLGHRTAPGETGPADVVGDNYLDDGVKRCVVIHAVGDGDAEGDAAPVRLVQLEGGREDEPRVGVLVDGIAIGRGGCYSS